MTEGLIDRIRSIPPLPETFVQIDAICDSPDGTIAELSKVVEKDPMLVANILKIVNSPLYGLRSEVKSVAQAVSLLGMKEISSLSATISVKKLLKVDMEPYGIAPEKFALISNMQGALIKKWVGRINREKAETLFMPALLQETGKIIIADEIVRNDEVFQFKSDIQTAVNIAQIENMYVDTTSSEVTAMIFEHWGFDEFLVDIIRYSDVPQNADDEYLEYSWYLNIAKTVLAINAPLSERNITIGLNHAKKSGLDDVKLLEAIESLKEDYEGEL
jgi:HD-like signal output (HDOD) protein